MAFGVNERRLFPEGPVGREHDDLSDGELQALGVQGRVGCHPVSFVWQRRIPSPEFE